MARLGVAEGDRIKAAIAVTHLPNPCCSCCSSDEMYRVNMAAVRQILMTGSCDSDLLSVAEEAIILREVREGPPDSREDSN